MFVRVYFVLVYFVRSRWRSDADVVEEWCGCCERVVWMLSKCGADGMEKWCGCCGRVVWILSKCGVDLVGELCGC